jgi:hypothetical protein
MAPIVVANRTASVFASRASMPSRIDAAMNSPAMKAPAGPTMASIAQ